MQKIKLTALLVMGLVVTGLFTSCDQKDSKTTETTTGTDATTTTPAPPPVVVKDTVVYDTTAKSRPLKPGN